MCSDFGRVFACVGEDDGHEASFVGKVKGSTRSERCTRCSFHDEIILNAIVGMSQIQNFSRLHVSSIPSIDA